MRLKIIERCHQSDSSKLVLSQNNIYNQLVRDLGHSDWCLDLVLVEDDAMINLNSQFRSKPSVTDVLSFSYLLEEGEGPCDLAYGKYGAGADLWLDPFAEPDHETQLKHIGEIILAPGFIASRCQDQNWLVNAEFPMLVVHGTLHLLGWDHIQEKEKEAMQDLEEHCLQDCELIHPLRSPEGH